MITKQLRNIIIAFLTIVIFILILVLSVKTPSITQIKSISFNSVDQGVVSANSFVTIKNPNWFSYNIKNLNVAIRYNDKVICSGTSSEPIQLTKSMESTHKFALKVFIDSLKWEIPSMLFKDSIPVEISLAGKIAPFGLNFKTNFNTAISTKNLLSQITTNN
jgi:LEA14-like dessication related protein